MINVNKIITASIDENLKSFSDEVMDKPSTSDEESQKLVYKALINYSGLLLDKYHQELKSELASHGIEI